MLHGRRWRLVRDVKAALPSLLIYLADIVSWIISGIFYVLFVVELVKRGFRLAVRCVFLIVENSLDDVVNCLSALRGKPTQSSCMSIFLLNKCF